MRSDIKMLCVTNWGAVLELKEQDKQGHYMYSHNGNTFITVADPDAIDSGMDIGIDEIKLIARVKKTK